MAGNRSQDHGGRRLVGLGRAASVLLGISMLVAGLEAVPAAAAGEPTVTAVSPVAGPVGGGTTVKVTGSGFTGATAVNFGTRAASSLNVISDAELVVVTPPGNACAAVDVIVVGATASSVPAPGAGFTYRCPGPPEITSVSPRGGYFDGGTVVTITGYDFAGTTAVKFGDVPAVSFTVDSYHQITAVSPPRAEGTVSGPPSTPPPPHPNTAFITVTNGIGSSPAGCPNCFPLALARRVSRFVYGEGYFHDTGGCAGGECPGAGHAVTLLSGKVLYIQGSMAQLFDPLTNTWSVTGECSGCPAYGSRLRHSLTLLRDGRVLLAGGGEGTSNAFLYDPATGTWSATGSMNVPRTGHAAALLSDGRVLTAGGCRQGVCLFEGLPQLTATAEIYDPTTGAWTPTGDMTQVRQFHSATLLDPTKGGCGTNCGKVLVAFGAGSATEDGQGVPSAELFDPSTGTWQATGSSNGSGRTYHAALQLVDGRVMALAGVSGMFVADSLTATEIFDPVQETWRLTGSQAFRKAEDAHAVLLPSGKVLSLYGNSSEVMPIDFTDLGEVWDPADGRWHITTPSGFRPPSPNAAVAVLPTGPVSICGSNCGKVVVAGGTPVFAGGATSQLYSARPVITGVAPGSGPAGTSVTVSGTGLASATKVRFGTADVAFSIDATTPDTKLVATAPATAGTYPVTVTAAGGVSSAATFTVNAPGTTVTPPPGTGTGSGTGTATGNGTSTGTGLAALLSGYRLAAADGGVFAFGQLPFLGSTGNIRLASPMVGMASTPSKSGYWMVASDGGVFAFGDAKFFGSMGGATLASPVVGMAATPSGNGYWLVAADGGLFAFGDAKFFGSTGAIRLVQPVVGMAAAPSGNGYWLVAKDGGIFAFGDAKFFGSTGAIRLVQPVVGMASTPTGNGYRMVAADGGIFAFGDAAFFGSTGAIRLAQPMVGMASTPSGKGYVLVAKDGGIFSFGDAGFFGSTGAIKLVQLVVGITAG